MYPGFKRVCLLAVMIPLILLKGSEASPVADSLHTAEVHYDSYNRTEIDYKYPWKNRTFFDVEWMYDSESLIREFPSSMVYDFPVSDSMFFYIEGSAGSEVGEPLLNRYETPGLPNRDHLTKLHVLYSTPDYPLLFSIGRQYIDVYSDHFDSLWSGYAEETGNRMEFDGRGLVTNSLIDYEYRDSRIGFSGSVQPYEHWYPAPYNYSPLYRTGYLFSQNIDMALNESRLRGSILYNIRKDYTEHIVWDRAKSVKGDMELITTPVKGTYTSLSVDFNSREVPGFSVNWDIKRELPELAGEISLDAEVNSDLKAGGGIDWYAEFLEVFRVDLNASMVQIPGIDPYEYEHISEQVRVEKKRSEAFRSHAELTWNNTMILPFSISGWLNYDSHPLMDAVRHKRDTMVVGQETHRELANWSFGLHLASDFRFKKFRARINTNGMLLPREKILSEYAAAEVEVKLSYGTGKVSGFYTELSLKNRSAFKKHFLHASADSVASYNANQPPALYATVKIPYALPFVKRYIKTDLCISAGPVYIGSDMFENQRYTHHPFGNNIGPLIELKLTGYIGHNRAGS